MAHLGSFNGGQTFRFTDEITRIVAEPDDLGGWAPEEPMSLGDLGQGWETALIAGAIAVASSLMANKTVRGFFFGETADAFLNYYNSVARSVGLELGQDPQEVLGRIMQTGTIPIYCSDSQGTRDDIAKAFEAMGWHGTKWSNKYAKGGGLYSWWFGITFRLQDVPPSLLTKALQDCNTDLNERMQRTLKLYTDAKHHMKTYGGPADKNNPATFEPLALVAIPLGPSMCVPAAQQSAMMAASAAAEVKPFYKKWWFWALLVGGLAATTTTIVLIRRRKA